MVDREKRRIRRISAGTGLGLKFVSKDIFLTRALNFLGSVSDDRYVLKGGTAISRGGHLSNPRFSEDVDLDVYVTGGARDAGSDFFSVLREMEGFEVKRPRRYGKGLRFDAYFNNHFGEKDRIRIETRPRQGPVPEDDVVTKTLLQSPFSGGEACQLRTYSKVYLFIMKIDALSNRSDGKDVFDLLGMWGSGIPVDDFLQALEGYIGEGGEKGLEIVRAALENLENMASDIRKIANSANHFIPRSERPDWKIAVSDLRIVLERFEKRYDKKN